uniref:RING-type domain-containing protein n=1 Tax=Steinernema glaseri TaxID=37863 RepID=A0A1I8ACJ9_9BILA
MHERKSIIRVQAPTLTDPEPKEIDIPCTFTTFRAHGHSILSRRLALLHSLDTSKAQTDRADSHGDVSESPSAFRESDAPSSLIIIAKRLLEKAARSNDEASNRPRRNDQMSGFKSAALRANYPTPPSLLMSAACAHGRNLKKKVTCMKKIDFPGTIDLISSSSRGFSPILDYDRATHRFAHFPLLGNAHKVPRVLVHTVVFVPVLSLPCNLFLCCYHLAITYFTWPEIEDQHESSPVKPVSTSVSRLNLLCLNVIHKHVSAHAKHLWRSDAVHRTADMEEIKARHEKTLNCPICYQMFTDPVQMACGHTYCRECLRKLISHHKKRDARGQQLIDCAVCRAPSRLHELSMNVNYVVKEATDIYRQLLSLKTIACSECTTNMDANARFFYCETCLLEKADQKDELPVTPTCSEPRLKVGLQNLICGACGLVAHKQHEVKELQKASEQDKRKRRIKLAKEVDWTRLKLSDLDNTIESFVVKMRSVRDTIHKSLLSHESVAKRFQEPVMFQKTLEEIATESKIQSTKNCRWIKTYLKQLKDMERRLPHVAPAAGDADVVTISDDEVQEVEQPEVEDDGSSRDSFVESLPGQNALPGAKLEPSEESLGALLMPELDSPSISGETYQAISFNMLGGSSFQAYAAPSHPQFQYHSYDPQPQQAFLPYPFPKPLPGYPRSSQFVPNTGYAQLPHH